jgi:hypothetical protein
VAENLIFTDREIEFLRELVRQNIEFMIVGLSAAALQGAPVVTQDVDLWFKDLTAAGIKKALKKVSGAYVPPSAINAPMFAGEAVKLFDIVVHMHGLENFDEEKKHALQVRLGGVDIPVLPLDRIIHSKKITGRQKDKLVLPVLKDALTAIREMSKDAQARQKKQIKPGNPKK